MSNIKLIALDLDGTLFNNSGKVTPHTIEIIKQTVAKGIHVVISTGRPFCGLPFDVIREAGIEYAITTNGAAVYHIADKQCLFENAMGPELTIPILEFLLSKEIHMDAFIEGEAYTPSDRIPIAKKLDMPESLKNYIISTRTAINDFTDYIKQHNESIQKMTLNFLTADDGTFVDREDVRHYLESRSDITPVCGGYHNLEFTKAGVTKGSALSQLATLLDIPIACTMAIGDTENDLSILHAAGLSIAMENATADVKAAADDITLSNENDGVAAAIIKHVLS